MHSPFFQWCSDSSFALSCLEASVALHRLVLKLVLPGLCVHSVFGFSHPLAACIRLSDSNPVGQSNLELLRLCFWTLVCILFLPFICPNEAEKDFCCSTHRDEAFSPTSQACAFYFTIPESGLCQRSIYSNPSMFQTLQGFCCDYQSLCFCR